MICIKLDSMEDINLLTEAAERNCINGKCIGKDKQANMRSGLQLINLGFGVYRFTIKDGKNMTAFFRAIKELIYEV